MAKVLIIARVFKAPVEKVWAAWTEPELIKKWWGPKNFTAPSIDNDLRVGGKYLYAMRGPAGSEFDKDMWSTGVYEEVEHLKKIVASDDFADEKGNVVPGSYYGLSNDFPSNLKISVSFEEQDGKTKFHLKHEGFRSDDIDDVRQGWNESLDKLAKTVEAK